MIKQIGMSAAAVAVALFITVSVIHMSNVNDNINELRKETELTRLQVQSFTKISDPKTVQFYVSELNKIVDNMHRLGKIIDEGEEVDLALARIEKQYDILGNKLDDMVTIKTHDKTRDDIQDVRNATVGHIDDLYMEIEDIDDKLDRQYKSVIKSLDIVEQEISAINKTLKTMNKKKFFHTHKD